MTPTVGWICTDPSLLTMAEAMLDQGYEDLSMDQRYENICRLGRIGSLGVVINTLPESSGSIDAVHIAQNTTTSFSGSKAILATGLCGVDPSSGIRLGDLVINPRIIRHENIPRPSSTVQRAVDVLHGEVGADGHWLSSNLPLSISNVSDMFQSTQRPNSDLPHHPQLHYGNVVLGNQDRRNEEFCDRPALEKDILVAADLWNLPVAVLSIFGVSKYVNSHESNAWKNYAAANAASYAKEVIQVMENDLMSSVEDIKGTEVIVPHPHTIPSLPPFQRHQYPRHGSAILLVIPTENEPKVRLLQEAFRERAPKGEIVHTVTAPVDSGVGEQPYNEAGILGAHNRISNALNRLHTTEYQKIFKAKEIGTVILASIENYIQTDNIDRPTDYGVVAIYNATTQQTTVRLSSGVTVPPAYVNRAQRFGFEGDRNQGRVTVGKILAANVPGLNKADWHAVLAGHSRYDLLKDAIRQIAIPW